MGTYGLPRNKKGEGRILFVFSSKALIFTTVGAMIGVGIYLLLSLIGAQIIGIIIALILGIIGFCIATFKIPEISALEITQKNGGQNIDEVILRYIKFKKKKNRIYLYTKEESKNE